MPEGGVWIGLIVAYRVLRELVPLPRRRFSLVAQPFKAGFTDDGRGIGSEDDEMGISLADALRQVDLQGGHVYQCQVGRFRVEVRVDDAVSYVLPAPLKTSDVMLDAWIDLPTLKSEVVYPAVPGSPLVPDIPDLPTD